MTGELLRICNVSKAYRRGGRRVPVLAEVSLDVGAGEIVAVLGSRYEGKTTLLQIAAGLTQPDTGEVWFDGLELTNCRPDKREALLQRDIAWIDGRDRHPRLKVVDRVGLPLALGQKGSLRDVRDRALEALERFGVAGCAAQYWSELSNWERVLVALSCGFVRGPKLMVVDDLFEGLGMRRMQDAGDLLSGMARQLRCGVLMSASDIEATGCAERIASFERGRLKVIDAGEPDGDGRLVDFPGPRSRGVKGASA